MQFSLTRCCCPEKIVNYSLNSGDKIYRSITLFELQLNHGLQVEGAGCSFSFRKHSLLEPLMVTLQSPFRPVMGITAFTAHAPVSALPRIVFTMPGAKAFREPVREQ
jgi:hypothetical protein